MKQIRVLLAEDDVLIATDLACELENSGMTIPAMTTSFASALKMINEKSLDFVLLNVRL